MSRVSSPTDLPTTRITSLFPFPVQGRVVAGDDVYLRLNLGRGSPPCEDLDVQPYLSDGPCHPKPFLGVHTTADAKWLRANDGADLVLIKLPLERLPFQIEDEVRLAENRNVSGKITSVALGRFEVDFPSASKEPYPAEALILLNWSTRC